MTSAETRTAAHVVRAARLRAALSHSRGSRVSNADILRQGYAAFAAGNTSEVLALLHDNIEWTEPAGHIYAGTSTGGDAIVENVFMRLGREWDSYLVEPDTFISEGDQVAALGWLSGTNKATGIAFRLDSATGGP
ncbi:MAG: nuclear transport factor 2 family protein [Propionibacteriaceae bacterium]